ncbi:ribosomal RNA-processing protein 12 [Vigna unguiculata]|uniref:Ribosomal RNA-processing protein 12 n=1 Tax=Vigna unguiculata TaxID=3917 RepID=A0A4D6MZI3_VIGUN|nr:ribosomal RNA-processing protein 12 [Vigna unguiculata]
MEEEHTEPFKDGSDLCQQLMDRYANSAAPQHRHLLATAAALRSNIAAESLPLTPPAYFAAAISALDAAEALDPVALSAVVSFMAIALPLVPPGGIAASKSHEASEILVAVLAREGEELGAACVRAMVKCLGVLIGFCDLEDWDGMKLGFEALLKFSICKRPKVRRCAQEAMEKVFKSIKSSTVTKEASKLVLSELKSCSALTLKLNALRTSDECTEDKVLKNEHLEVLHLMNLINLIAPYLSTKIILKVLSEVHKLFSFMSPELARHALKTIEAIFEAVRIKNIVLETEDIVVSLTSFVSLRDKNPLDTVILASKLLRVAMDLLYNGQISLWIKNLPPVCRSVIGLLTFEGNTASQASSILKDVLKHHISPISVLMGTDQTFHDGSLECVKADAIKSTCAVFEDALSSADGIPNEHVLSAISVLFLELGEFSLVLMRNIVLKLADLMVQISGGKVHNEHLQKCIGSAVYAMGIERFLSLVPVSLDEHSYTYSNIWLVPILKRYVSGASLAYYMERIMPLAKSFKKASRKVGKSEISQEMMACAHDLLGLLPGFCRHATDTYQNFTRLSDVLVTFLKKDPSMHQNVSKTLQILVNENKAALSPKKSMEDCLGEYDFLSEFNMQPTYSKKTATKNIKSLASCSNQLLYVLSDLFISSLPEARLSLKGAIGCLASVTDSSVIKELLLSVLKRFQLVDCEGEAKVLSSPGEVDSDQSDLKGCFQRCLILEMVSCLVEGAKDNLIEIIYNLTIHSFQESDESVHQEAYNTMSKILEENQCFSSARYVELIDLLHGLKPPTAIASLRSRYSCFHLLMIHAMKANLEEEENSKVFLILNEIILTLKDGKDETRKEAYDLLLNISSTLRDSLYVGSIEPYHKLVSMIMGYLSGSSPHIKSGAVSALSVLVYQDTSLLISVSGLVPSLLSLLQTKDVEIIKAVLGFVKVMVSTLQARELQNILSDVITEILPWSSVSRHHFRSKVTVIFEILLRKCGSAAVKLVTPEKYKFFLKNVLENRHGKSSEAGTKDSENIPQDSSTKRPEWRKPVRAATSDKDSIKNNKRKRDNKFETAKPWHKEPFKSTSNDGLSLPKRSRPEESRKGKKSGNKSFIGGGGKRNVKMSSTEKNKAAPKVPTRPSKSHKLKGKFQRN